jgi:hypothetical protein
MLLHEGLPLLLFFFGELLLRLCSTARVWFGLACGLCNSNFAKVMGSTPALASVMCWEQGGCPSCVKALDWQLCCIQPLELVWKLVV